MSILASTAIDVTKVKTRWTEPYVSEALNRALSTMPKGIYHGFVITPDGGTVVRLSQDAVLSESMAVVENSLNGSKFVYREDTEVTFDLAAFNGQTVYVFVYVNYTIGVATTAYYRVVDAAELVNSWINSATLLGTVRVPSAGAIDLGDIEQASAELAGLNGSENSRWKSVNQNPKFSKGLAGYTIASGDPAAYLAWSGANLRMGDISGAQAPASRVRLRKAVSVDNLEVGDYLCVRVRAGSSNVANGAVLRLSFGDQWDQVIIDSNVATRDHGFIYQWTGSETGLQILEIDADLLAGATATGYFTIESVEVYVLRMSAFLDDPEKDPGFNAVCVGDGSEIAYGWMNFDDDGGNSKTFAFSRYDGGSFDTVLLSSDGDRTISDSAPSLVAADNAAIRTTKVQDELFPFAFFSGGSEISTNDGAAQVTVGETVVRGTTGTMFNSDERYLTIAQSTVTVPVSGGVGIDDFFIAADPATGAFVSFLEASLGANLDKVLLFWGQYDNNTTSFLGRIAIADLMADISNSIPVTVGNSDSGARYSDLAGVLRLINAGSYKGPKEVWILDGPTVYSIAASNPARRNIPVTDGVKIKGIGKPRVAVFSLTTTLFDIDGQDVSFEGIEFYAGAGTGAGSICIGETSATGTVEVKDCSFLNSLFERCISLSPGDTIDGAPGRLIVSGCYMSCSSAGYCINTLGGFLHVSNCIFNGDEASNGIAINDSTGVDGAVISGCSFRAQSLPQVFDCPDASISDCEFFCETVLNGSGQKLSNCFWDFTLLAGTDLTALLVSANNVQISNIKITNPTGGVSALARGVDVGASDYVNLCNAVVSMTDGAAFDVGAGGTNNNFMNIRGSDAGSDAARVGLIIDGNLNMFMNMNFSGYADDSAIDLNGDNNIVGQYVVDQATPGGVGGSFAGSNNLVTTVRQVV